MYYFPGPVPDLYTTSRSAGAVPENLVDLIGDPGRMMPMDRS